MSIAVMGEPKNNINFTQQATQSRLDARGQVAPMCICWHMFKPDFRECLLLLAGFSRLQYLPVLNRPWENIPVEFRLPVMKTVNQMIAEKEAARAAK